jgi:hypothetical protein
MALLQISQHLLNDPKTIKAIYNTFETVEEVPVTIDRLYKTFRVTGQGVPLDDKHIVVGFEHGLDGNTKISGWSFMN